MPKIEGTRKQIAEELLKRITRGPSFSDLAPGPKFDPAEATCQYQRWAQSWILEDLQKLVPELRKRVCVSCGQPASAKGCEDAAGFPTHPALR